MQRCALVLFGIAVVSLGIFTGATLKQAWLSVRDTWEAIIVAFLIVSAVIVFVELVFQVFSQWKALP